MFILKRNSDLISWLFDPVRVFAVAFLLSVAIFIVWLLTAASWKTDLPRAAQQSPEISKGEQVFKENGCFYSCHALGPLSNEKAKLISWNQQGVLPPDLTASTKRTDDWLLAYLIYPQELIPSSPMRSYDYLGDEKLRSLITYLQSIKKPTSSINATPPEITEIPQVPLNNQTYQKGRYLYGIYCKGCHGDVGNGKGVVGHLLLPEPRDFTDAVWMSKQTDSYLYSVIMKGKANTAMSVYREIFSPVEIAMVLNYIKLFSDPITRQRLELPIRDNNR